MEIWKKIDKFDHHECSTEGRIRNTLTGKTLSPVVSSRGYAEFCLCEFGKRHLVFGHRVVAETFLPKVDGKTFVNHKDGNKLNNNVNNLEWCTSAENTHHAINVLGKNNGGLNKKRVLCIETNTIFESTVDAEKQMGISNAWISSICRGEKNSAKGYHFKYV